MLDRKADNQKLLAQVLDFYHRTLLDSPEALEYLRQRGVSGEAVDKFRIGYANRTLGPMLPDKQLKAGAAIRARLQQLGILRASGHEHFNGCVVFPIDAADGSGQVVDIYGRKTGDKLRKGTPLDMFQQRERCGIWNPDGFAGDEVIVASLFDALAFWSSGCRNVTCCFGELTDDHYHAFVEFGIRRVMVVDDTLAPGILEAGLDCFHLRMPKGIDAATYAAQFANPAEALGAIVRRAEWLGKGQPSEPAPPVAEPEPEPLPDHDDARDEVAITFDERRYRVRGLAKNLSYDTLRINLLATTAQGLFVDTFDLYSAKHRRQYTVQAAEELGVDESTIKRDLGRVLLKLEELQERQIEQSLAPATPTITEAEKDEALRLLRDPKLLDRIVADIPLVGEASNKLLAYVAAVSRKLDQPLAIIVQSSSAAGKTTLMEAILDLMPPEEQVKYSAMTGQSLYYLEEDGLKHRILAIVEEEGAERASYALKLLQSEGELMIASTGKDVSSGRLITQTYRVEGPVMIFLTTTAIKIDEELLNRCIVLSVDEDREQTKAIHQLQRQRQTLAGLLASRDHEQTITLHRNAQRLLRPLLVANPYAEQLTFLNHKTRTRRDHLKYLTLIRAVTLLHQYQRPIRNVLHNGQEVEYIEATLDDIQLANRLVCDALGRSVDDLPPQTGRLLSLIETMPQDRFTRRDVREYTAWGDTQLKVHLRRLVELEYLWLHRVQGKPYEYELLHGLPQQSKFLAGLIDVDQLQSGAGRPVVGGRSEPR